MATLLLCTGFEHGLNTPASWVKGNATCKYADTVTGTPQIISGGRNGSYCSEISISAGAESIEWNTDTFGTSKTVMVVGFAINFPTAIPTADQKLIWFANTGSIDMCLYFRDSDDRFIILWNNFTGTPQQSTVVITAGVWYWFDMRATISGTSRTIDWAINGVAQPQWTGTSTSDTFSRFILGDPFDVSTYTARFDDVLISTTSGDYPLGDHKVTLLKPDTADTAVEIGTANATGRMVTNSAIDATFSSADILAATSEVPPLIGASATGVGQRTSGATNAVGVPMTSYALQSGESISGVRVEICGWAASTLASSWGLRTFNGVTETVLFAAAACGFDNNTTTPAWMCKMAVAADFDTQAELDALVVRQGYSTDISPLPGAHAIYAETAIKTSAAAAAALPILIMQPRPGAV